MPGQAALASAPPLPASATCGTLAPQKADQTNDEYRFAQLSLNNLCAPQGTVSPQNTAYGIYNRLVMVAPKKTCSCGGSYRAWSIDASTAGVPYDGDPNHLSELVLLWRFSTTGAWSSEVRPVDTYNSIPTQSGTMGVNKILYGNLDLLDYTGRVTMDHITSSAP